MEFGHFNTMATYSFQDRPIEQYECGISIRPNALTSSSDTLRPFVAFKSSNLSMSIPIQRENRFGNHLILSSLLDRGIGR